MRLMLPVLFAHAAGAQPLSLHATPAKSRTLAGESIVIQIEQAVSSDLDMETVELNRTRTRLTVVPLATPAARRILSGSDYIALHHVEGMVQVGDSFQAPAGRKWTSELNLFDYTRPPAPGRYRIEISYRYGNAENETVRANAVEIEVLPARAFSAAFRRFGWGAGEVLRGLWQAEAAGGTRYWMYQESAAFDPGVVTYAVEVGQDLDASARLAHLNEIPGQQFSNYAVWSAGTQVCRLAVSREGREGNPACAATGLAGSAVLAEPALQKSEGLAAVVTGRTADGKPAASLVNVAANGKTTYKVLILPEPAVSARVGWVGESQSPMLLYASPGRLALMDLATGSVRQLGAAVGAVQLAVDQWMGEGRYWAFVEAQGTVQAKSWSLDGRKQTSSQEVRVEQVRGIPLVATFGPESADFALQFDRVLVAQAGARTIAQPGALALIASLGGIFSIENGNAGLRVTRAGETGR